ncbi:hypothetical protein F5I97DRAFT_1171619 [Phlebopus sp. FC_14]|nr:hypothetical protein F5I97DRAFT_1171619 [Phlebopus sp. FC_14]
MAAPPSVSSKDMSGRFVMNKTLSDSTDEILRLQGVSWFKRRAIAMFTLTLVTRHYTDDAGVEHIDIAQILSGGIPATDENRTLDFQEHDEDDDVFGAVVGHSRRIAVRDVTDPFLKEGWTTDTIEHGVVLAVAWSHPERNRYKWRAEQTWGFEVVNGERRYVRHVKFTSSDKKDGPIHARLVYDYEGN